MTDKIVKLTKVDDLNKPETYKEAITRHLNALTEEQKNVVPEVLFVATVSSGGTAYQILCARNVLEVVGTLDLLKHYIFLDEVMGE